MVVLEALCKMPELPLRLRIDMRALAFGLHGYYLFQTHFPFHVDWIGHTVDRLTETLARTDQPLRPRLLLPFLETVLEFRDPKTFGYCLQRVLLRNEPCLTETLQCAADMDLAELIVTFTTRCQVHPSELHADENLVPDQLSIFANFLLLVRKKHGLRTFILAAQRLQPRLRPLLLWLFVAFAPNKSVRLVSWLVAERRSSYRVARDIFNVLRKPLAGDSTTL